MRGFTRVLGIVLVNLAVLGGGIVIVELLFGAWLNPNALNRLNLLRDRTFTYDVSTLYEAGSPIIKYSRDKYGLRGDYGGRPSRIELLTVGGSTTDQRYIADGSTWQDVLQQQFALSGAPVVVANAGVDGQSTYGHIRNFDWWFPHVPGLKPKYVLFYVGRNDLYVSGGFAYDALMGSGQRSALDEIRDNSAVWHLARTLIGTYRATVVLGIGHRRIDFSRVRWVDRPVQGEYGFLEPRLAAYADRLRVLVDKARSAGAAPIFVTQPSMQFRFTENGVEGRAELGDYDGRRINGLDYYHLSRRFDAVLEVVCAERQAVFFDMAGETRWTEGDFYDNAHMTPRGARKVGLYLFERLRPIVRPAVERERGSARPSATLDG